MRKELFVVTRRSEAKGGGEVLSRCMIPFHEILTFYEDMDENDDLTRTCVIFISGMEMILDIKYSEFKKLFEQYQKLC